MTQNYKIAIRKHSDVTIHPLNLNSLIKIDKLTCQYLDKSDFIKRFLNLPNEELDIYIIKQEKEKNYFYDIVYNNTDYTLIHFVNNISENGKIELSDSFLNNYVGRLIYHLKQDCSFKNYMIKVFPHFRDYFESFVEDTILLNSIRYKRFLSQLSNYNTIRKIIICEKIYNNEIPNLYQVRFKSILKPKDNIIKREINVTAKPKYIKEEEIREDDIVYLTDEEKEMMTGEGNSLYKPFL